MPVSKPTPGGRRKKAVGGIVAKKRSSRKPFASDVHSHIDVPEAKSLIDRLPASAGGRASFGIRERPDEQARIDARHKPLRGDPVARAKAIDKLGFDLQGISFACSEGVVNTILAHCAYDLQSAEPPGLPTAHSGKDQGSKKTPRPTQSLKTSGA